MTIPLRVPDAAELKAAAERLRGRIRRTPILELDGQEVGVQGSVLLKLELLQHVGVFKTRGALNTLLSTEVPPDGVVAASGGNHGAAVAWAAREVGVKAQIFVPKTSPQAKVDRVRSYGADVHLIDGYYPEALIASKEWAAERDVLQIHAYDMTSVVAGASTLGQELVEQVPEATAVLVSCGGGGLYAGTALGVGDAAQVHIVEPELCPTMHAALEAGEPVETTLGGVASDSMAAPRAGAIPYAVATSHHARSFLVTDEAIIAARKFLWERCRLLAEPGGATAFASLLSKAYVPGEGDTTVVVISGGNHLDFPSPSDPARRGSPNSPS
ncbi:threonine/serine dehydratase [Tenggerimyces flavus]|uniref:Threonine/serine dehydratase n=1 Tax=Tenggerimyces flavus TaxID=1708749 RepID=A0ABV7Y6K8_9ACTN|nr:threonine/serine dehydratase [Tenggerimyces flavus]MBM7790859.1 threonine dehydratase [Tenggerimyces flavus]